MAQESKIVPVSAAVIALGVIGALAWALLTGQELPDDAPPAPPAEEAAAGEETGYFRTDRVDLAPIAVQASALDAARARMPGTGDAAPPAVDKVRAAQLVLGRAERTGAPASAQQDAQHRFTLQLTNVLATHGRPGLQALERALWEDFSAAIRAVSSRGDAPGALAASTGSDLDPQLDTLGSFLRLGPTLGLLGPQGEVAAEAWPIIRLAFRVRLFGSLAGSATPGELLAPAETRAFYLWRLHNAPVTDKALRMRWAGRMPSYVSGYPYLTAQVAILARAGDLQAATEALTLAREEEPSLTKVHDAWLHLLTPAKNP